GQQERIVRQWLAEVPGGGGVGEIERGEAGCHQIGHRRQGHDHQYRERRRQAPGQEPSPLALQAGDARPRKAGGGRDDHAYGPILYPPMRIASTDWVCACFSASAADSCFVAIASIARLILSPTCGNTGTVRYFM